MIITTNRKGFTIHQSHKNAYQEFLLERSTGNKFSRTIRTRKQWIINQLT
jgi:hypothetical protein